MANIDKKELDVFQKWFGIGIKPDADKSSDKLFFTDYKNEVDKEGKPRDPKSIEKVKFPPAVQKAYDFWIDQHDNTKSWEDRQELWIDLESLYFNCSLIARAIDLMADETVQADVNMQPIFVEAKEDQKKFILEFFEKIGIAKLLRSLAKDIVHFGNAGLILGMDHTGVNEVIPVDVFQLKDRLEFTPFEIEAEMKKTNQGTIQKLAGKERILQLIDTITNKDNITSAFKSYLLGFQIGDYILPPWRFLHFRNLTTRSPFKPFGVPFYVHAIAPYRQWDAGMTFQVMARVLQFPVEKYTINVPNVVDPAEKLSYLVNFIEKLDNIGISQSNKEDKSLGTRIFTVEGAFDYEILENNIDLKKMEDLEMLRDELIVATRLPRFIIDPNDGGFGEGGGTLLQKWKELARNVFNVQSILLENITQLTKIHMIQSKKWEEENIEFIVSMPYPEAQVDSDLISNQQDLISLVNDICDMLSDRLMDGEPLPQEVIRDVMNQILPYDQVRVDDWVDIIEKSKEEDEEEPDDGDNGDEFDDFESTDDVKEVPEEDEEEEKLVRKSDGLELLAGARTTSYKEEKVARKTWRKLQEKVGTRKLQEDINNIILESRIQSKIISEGVVKNRHYYTSSNRYLDFESDNLVKFRKERVQKIQDGTMKDEKLNLREEIKHKYVYKSNKKEGKK